MKAAILILICLVAPSAFGQSKNTDLDSKIKTFRNAKKFTVEYDRFKDETHISLQSFLVKVRNSRSVARLEMTADLFFKGTPTQGTKPIVLLNFRVYGTDWRFLTQRSLYALIGGKRQDLGEGQRSGDIVPGIRRVTELLVFNLPVTTFAAMAHSNQLVELQVGGLEITLEDEHKESFRNLLSLIGDEGQRHD